VTFVVDFEDIIVDFEPKYSRQVIKFSPCIDQTEDRYRRYLMRRSEKAMSQVALLCNAKPDIAVIQGPMKGSFRRQHAARNASAAISLFDPHVFDQRCYPKVASLVYRLWTIEQPKFG
jgi:hypothetical protein